MNEAQRNRREMLAKAVAFIVGPVVGFFLAFWIPEKLSLSESIGQLYTFGVQLVILWSTIVIFGFIAGAIVARALIITYEDQQDEARRQERRNKRKRN